MAKLPGSLPNLSHPANILHNVPATSVENRWQATHAKIIELATPTFVNGQWKKPKLSRRKLADLRKKFILAGVPFPELPKKIKPGVISKVNRPPKGHKWQREKQLRLQRIKENLPKIQKMIADMKKARQLEKEKEEDPLEPFFPKKEFNPDYDIIEKVLETKGEISKPGFYYLARDKDLELYEKLYGNPKPNIFLQHFKEQQKEKEEKKKNKYKERERKLAMQKREEMKKEKGKQENQVNKEKQGKQENQANKEKQGKQENQANKENKGKQESQANKEKQGKQENQANKEKQGKQENKEKKESKSLDDLD